MNRRLIIRLAAALVVLLAIVSAAWWWRYGTQSHGFYGFGYTYADKAGAGVVRYEIKAFFQASDDPGAPVFLYQCQRFRTSLDASMDKPYATSSARLPLTTAQVQAITRALRTWKNQDQLDDGLSASQVYPRLDFIGLKEDVPLNGFFGQWGEGLYYEITVSGTPVPPEVVSFIRTVNQSLPASIRAKWPLPLPGKRADSGSPARAQEYPPPP